jgi:hypothetical protein
MIISKTAIFDKALMFSLNAYNGRLDQAGVPRNFHRLRIVTEFGDKETWAAVALLHDVVEGLVLNVKSPFSTSRENLVKISRSRSGP